MVASAMLMPPEAEPVIPARVVVVIASFKRGCWMAFPIPWLTALKPGSAAMTPPKPYSDAVLRAASIAPPTAALAPTVSWGRMRLYASRTTLRMPTSRAPSTAQTAVSLPTSRASVCAIPSGANSKVLG
ncbi:hypothetical protein D3C86_1572830 [compost metagenome]